MWPEADYPQERVTRIFYVTILAYSALDQVNRRQITGPFATPQGNSEATSNVFRQIGVHRWQYQTSGGQVKPSAAVVYNGDTLFTGNRASAIVRSFRQDLAQIRSGSITKYDRRKSDGLIS